MEKFYPKYKARALREFEDLRVLVENGDNKKYFPAGMLEYIFKVQENLKQIHIEKDYIINDNKRGDHHYKYTKNILYIEKEQVENAAKEIRYVEKAAFIDLKKENIDKEIIENKIALKEEEEKEEKEIGEEEDAANVFG